MQEIIPKAWEADAHVYDTIGETTVSQMNDITTSFGLLPEHGVFSGEDNKELSDFVKENDGDLEALLSELDYQPDQLTQADLARLKVCLMTPRFVDAQHARSDLGDKSVKRELCEYNQALKEMIILHPDKSLTELEEMLTKTLIWSGMSEPDSRLETQLLRRELKGARGELAIHQFARSELAELVGIVPETSSLDDDLKGIDLVLQVPIVKNHRHTTVRMEIDVKNDPKAVKFLQYKQEDRRKNYRLDTNNEERIIMWSHVTEEEFGDKAMLSPDDIERYSNIVVQEFIQAAEDLYNRTTSWKMGGYALQSA